VAEATELNQLTTRYLLDMSIVLSLIRANPLGRWLEATYRLSDAPANSLVSVVTVGELMSFAYQAKGWAQAKRTRYESLLRELVWIDINDAAVLDAYAQIDGFSISTGRTMSKNDVWIAACARVAAATLLTTDKDFDHLHGTWIDRIWIDPNTGKKS
jgi:tRNA(fMet)-specific endonuclease VapC